MGEGARPNLQSGTSDQWTPPEWPDDPVEVLARVFALRQVADLGRFPHKAEWDTLEAEAKARISGRSTVGTDQTGPVDPPVLDLRGAAPLLADPMAAFVQVSAARIVAEEAGMGHASDWDRTEAAARDQLSRPAAPTGDPAEGPAGDPPVEPSTP